MLPFLLILASHLASMTSARVAGTEASFKADDGQFNSLNALDEADSLSNSYSFAKER